MKEPLAPFEPRWEGETLVLTVRRVSPGLVASWVIAPALATSACLVWLLGPAPLAADLALASPLVLLLGGVTWWTGWRDTTELRLRPDGLQRGGRLLPRGSVLDVYAGQRMLVVAENGWAGLRLHLLTHEPVALAHLARTIAAWRSDPTFGPDNLARAPRTDVDLLERLAPLDPRPDEGGLSIPLRAQRARDFAGMPLAVLVAMAVGYAVGADAGVITFMVAMLLAAVGPMLGQLQRRATLRIDDRGVTLDRSWFEPWGRIEGATVTDDQGVRLHLVGGGQRLVPLVGNKGAPRLAAVLTDLAQPDTEDPPEAAHRVQQLRRTE